MNDSVLDANSKSLSAFYSTNWFLRLLHLDVFKSLRTFHKVSVLFALSMIVGSSSALVSLGVLGSLNTGLLAGLLSTLILGLAFYYLALFSSFAKDFIIKTYFEGKSIGWYKWGPSKVQQIEDKTNELSTFLSKFSENYGAEAVVKRINDIHGHNLTGTAYFFNDLNVTDAFKEVSLKTKQELLSFIFRAGLNVNVDEPNRINDFDFEETLKLGESQLDLTFLEIFESFYSDTMNTIFHSMERSRFILDQLTEKINNESCSVNDHNKYLFSDVMVDLIVQNRANEAQMLYNLGFRFSNENCHTLYYLNRGMIPDWLQDDAGIAQYRRIYVEDHNNNIEDHPLQALQNYGQNTHNKKIHAATSNASKRIWHHLCVKNDKDSSDKSYLDKVSQVKIIKDFAKYLLEYAKWYDKYENNLSKGLQQKPKLIEDLENYSGDGLGSLYYKVLAAMRSLPLIGGYNHNQLGLKKYISTVKGKRKNVNWEITGSYRESLAAWDVPGEAFTVQQSFVLALKASMEEDLGGYKALQSSDEKIDDSLIPANKRYFDYSHAAVSEKLRHLVGVLCKRQRNYSGPNNEEDPDYKRPDWADAPACIGGTFNAFFEALQGTHPCVPFFETKESVSLKIQAELVKKLKSLSDKQISAWEDYNYHQTILLEKNFGKNDPIVLEVEEILVKVVDSYLKENLLISEDDGFGIKPILQDDDVKKLMTLTDYDYGFDLKNYTEESSEKLTVLTQNEPVSASNLQEVTHNNTNDDGNDQGISPNTAAVNAATQRMQAMMMQNN